MATRKRTAEIGAVVVVALLAATPVLLRLASGTGRATNSIDPLGSALEGAYTETHTVAGVDGESEAVADVVDVFRYDASHVFVRVTTRFDIGASCEVAGIAARENDAFVYRTRIVPSDVRVCTLNIQPTANAVHITDQDAPGSVGSCQDFCGVRGSLADVTVGHKRPMLDQDIVRLRNSAEFADAVHEFNSAKR